MYANYVSTRGGQKEVFFTDVVLNPAAENGGIYVPKNIFKFNLNKLKSLSYSDLSFLILQSFQIDLDSKKISEMFDKTYKNFDNPENPAPVKMLAKDFAVCELYHGPTRAFKDIALQSFMNLFSMIIEKEDHKYLILIATSGDTGPAVLSAAADKTNIKIFCMYPNNGISSFQELQMLTQNEENLKIVAIDGDFDDAQMKLGSLIRDSNMQKELLKKEVKISVANSINFARIVFQIVYHFWSYFQFVKQSDTMELGNKFNSVIPSGNFGNALAAYYARKMGLPIDKIIIATNQNDVLADFINRGIYDLNDRELVKTSSPAMDILRSSNVERILFELFGADRTKQLMEDLEKDKAFYLEDAELEVLQEIFLADFAAEDEVLESIKDCYMNFSYVIDPHTANAFVVYRKVNTYDIPTIIYSTAEWTKFPSVMARVFDINLSCFSDSNILNEISKKLNLVISKNVKEIFTKKEQEKQIIKDINKVDYEILKFVNLL